MHLLWFLVSKSDAIKKKAPCAFAQRKGEQRNVFKILTMLNGRTHTPAYSETLYICQKVQKPFTIPRDLL